jgi:CBS-domain-containing membrane protein
VRAKDVMSDEVTSVAAAATVFQAASLLIGCGARSLPVVDEKGSLVGMVSEADLLRHGGASPTPVFRHLRRLSDRVEAAAAFVHVHSKYVRDIMSTNVATATEDDNLQDIARLMLEHDVLRIPIRRGRSVVGMVDRADLLRVMIAHRSSDAQLQQPAVKALSAPDQELRDHVLGAVRGQAWSLAERADVVVSDGIAHLWGVVPSDMVRKAYRVAAENVHGVREVVLHMHVVAPPARIGG